MGRQFPEHLPRRVFAEADRCHQVLDLMEAIFLSSLLVDFVLNFLQVDVETPSFLIQQALTEIEGLLASPRVDPLADLVARFRSLHDSQPVAAGTVTLLR